MLPYSKQTESYNTIHVCFCVQGLQQQLAPIDDAALKTTGKQTVAPTSQKGATAKEYGADLPFRLPNPDRTADDVVLALCAVQNSNGAAPADDR